MDQALILKQWRSYCYVGGQVPAHHAGGAGRGAQMELTSCRDKQFGPTAPCSGGSKMENGMGVL